MKKITLLALLVAAFVSFEATAKPKSVVVDGEFETPYDPANNNTTPEVGKWVAVMPNKGNGPLLVTPDGTRKNHMIKIEAQENTRWYSGGLVQLVQLDPEVESYTLTMDAKSISDKFRVCVYIRNGVESKESEYFILSSFDPVDSKNASGTTATKDVKDGIWTPISFKYDMNRVSNTTYSPASTVRAGRDYMLNTPSDRGNQAYICIYCMTADQSGLIDNIQMIPNK